MMQRIVRNERLTSLLVTLLWGAAGITLGAVLLSLIPVPREFFWGGDPLIRIATTLPLGRPLLLIGAAALFAAGSVVLYHRTRFEEQYRTRS